MAISNIEIQDENGNIYYPKTASNNVFFEDGTTFQQKLDGGALRGQQGSKGDTGEKGERGEQGIQGLTGANGKDGVSISTNLVDGKATGSIKSKNIIEDDTNVLGEYSVSFGYRCKASGNYSHAESNSTIANGDYSHAEGYGNTATGNYSHAEGFQTTTTATFSHTEGSNTTANGLHSHAEGYNTIATGSSSHTEGRDTMTTGEYSHAEGRGTKAEGGDSHAEGYSTTAKGECSHAEGYNTTAKGGHSHAEGCYAISYNDYSHAQGKFNKQVSNDDMFWIGNGTADDKRSNALRVTSAGATYGMSAFNSTGADYAEFFEWSDGNPNNEDRVGYFVTFENDKIKIANINDDYILGIISGNPSVIGNSHNDMWNEMYIRDEFDRIVYEDVEVPDTFKTIHHDAVYENQNINPLDIDTNKESNILISEAYDEEVLDEPKHMKHRMKLNPKYDPSHEYIPREKRPEWSAVGMFGVLSVYDDGTCTVNGYAKVSNNGTATKSDNGYRVLKRVTNNIVKILFRS